MICLAQCIRYHYPKFKTVIGKYLEIFSDPFFWLMAAIAFAIGFWVYRKYVIGNPGVSEEVDLLQIRLNGQGYTYLSSEVIYPNSTRTTALNPPAATQSTDADGGGIVTSSRVVKAATPQGKPVELLARFEYRNAALIAVTFEPELGGG